MCFQRRTRSPFCVPSRSISTPHRSSKQEFSETVREKGRTWCGLFFVGSPGELTHSFHIYTESESDRCERILSLPWYGRWCDFLACCRAGLRAALAQEWERWLTGFSPDCAV